MRRAAAALVLACLLGFVAAMATAMRRYPGGTWEDRTTPGHSFWANFFCDLQSPVALNGATNEGAALARLGAWALLAGLAPHFALISWRLKARRAWLAPSLALAAAAAAALTPVLPSTLVGRWHAVAVLVAVGPGLLALLQAVRLARGAAWRGVEALGAPVVLVLAAGDALLYGASLRGWVAPGPVAALQKLAAGALATWMAATAIRALAAPRP